MKRPAGTRSGTTPKSALEVWKAKLATEVAQHETTKKALAMLRLSWDRQKATALAELAEAKAILEQRTMETVCEPLTATFRAGDY